jgi:hypothetical protein
MPSDHLQGILATEHLTADVFYFSLEDASASPSRRPALRETECGHAARHWVILTTASRHIP